MSFLRQHRRQKASVYLRDRIDAAGKRIPDTWVEYVKNEYYQYHPTVYIPKFEIRGNEFRLVPSYDYVYTSHLPYGVNYIRGRKLSKKDTGLNFRRDMIK